MSPAPSLLGRLVPVVFVLLWATGFVVARLVVPHVQPLSFLVLRYVGCIAAFGLAAGVARAPWPRGAGGWRDALASGVLMQGIYLGGVFWAIRHGLPAGISALMAGLQPLLTAVLARPLLGERVGARRWLGIGLGLAGAGLVLLPGLQRVGADRVPPVAAAVCLAAILSLTLGTILQKRRGGAADLRTTGAVQFLAALVVTLPVAALTEPGPGAGGFGASRFDGSWAAWAGLAWSVFGISVGATSMLLLLIRRGAVAGVASLFYLVPPVAAAMAYGLFGEQLAPIQGGGMLLAAAGVAVASRG